MKTPEQKRLSKKKPQFRYIDTIKQKGQKTRVRTIPSFPFNFISIIFSLTHPFFSSTLLQNDTEFKRCRYPIITFPLQIYTDVLLTEHSKEFYSVSFQGYSWFQSQYSRVAPVNKKKDKLNISCHRAAPLTPRLHFPHFISLMNTALSCSSSRNIFQLSIFPYLLVRFRVHSKQISLFRLARLLNNIIRPTLTFQGAITY